MTRHYMNHSILQLEGIVNAAEHAQNSGGLKVVRDELKHRSTQRAKELLARTEGLLLTLKTGPSRDKAPDAGQLELGVGDPLPLGIPVPVPAPPALPTPSIKAAPPKAAPRVPLPILGAQEAAKVLGVPLAARWDVVEAARARLVHAAIFPTEQRAQPDVEAARKFNVAYVSMNAGRRY